MEVLPLKEIPEDAHTLFGGKAAQLGALGRRGAPVPAGVALAVSCFEGGRLREECRDALGVWLSQFAGERFVVRSSAVAEDSAHASCAGWYLTVADVAALDAAEAAARVAASGPPGAVAVVVQRQVDAAWGGVLFTRDPVTGRPGHVVEFVQGRPAALLSGGAEPVRLRLSPDGRIAEGAAPAGFPVAVLGQLARLAGACEEAIHAPVDVEWGINSGGVWIFQARPVTSLPAAPPEDGPDAGRMIVEEEDRLAAAGAGVVWTRAPLAEGMDAPGALTREIWERVFTLEGAYGLACRSIGYSPPARAECPLEWIAGRPYLRTDRLARFHAAGLPVALRPDRFGQLRAILDGGAALRMGFGLPAGFVRFARSAWRSRSALRDAAREWELRDRPDLRERLARAAAARPAVGAAVALASHLVRVADDWATRGALPWIRAGLLAGQAGEAGEVAGGADPHDGTQVLDLATARAGEWDPAVRSRWERAVRDRPSSAGIGRVRAEARAAALALLDEVRWAALALGSALGIGSLVFDLRLGEISDLASSRGEGVRRLRGAALTRRALREAWETTVCPWVVRSDVPNPLFAPAAAAGAGRGVAMSPGVGEGPAFVGEDPSREVPAGSVLVLTALTPPWAAALARATAVVTEAGGILSHGAILAREARVPAVGSVPGARRLRGRLRVNGTAGTVEPLHGAA